jgi:hypothetical protein
VASLVGALAGCASVAVTDDAIATGTARALSLAPGSFTVADRVNEGMKTSYTVKTSDGRSYACYMTGTVAITGRTVSDPICAPAAGATSKTNAGSSSGSSCNALLRAAGKCQ